MLSVSDDDEEQSTRHQAEYVNNFFSNVGSETFKKSRLNLRNFDDGQQNLRINLSNTSDMMFRHSPITWETVTLIIKHLKNSNSHGSDGIPLRYIKDSLPVIITYLTCILVN